MSIPHFKSQHDWEAFTQIFDSQWHCKKALLDRVKDDMFPNTSWHGLTAKSIEVINDIVTNLLYDVDYEAPNGDYIKSYPLITRVEVIGKDGREYVNYECSNVQVSEQDQGRTLKVFLS